MTRGPGRRLRLPVAVLALAVGVGVAVAVALTVTVTGGILVLLRWAPPRGEETPAPSASAAAAHPSQVKSVTALATEWPPAVLPRLRVRPGPTAAQTVDCVAPSPMDAASDAGPGGAHQAAPTKRAFADLRRSLSSRPDERSRAATSYLQLLETDMATAARGEKALDSLARLAVTSTDPQVYGLALQTCGAGLFRAEGAPGAVTPACALLNPAQWARLAPNNVRAYFGVASRARAAGDAAGELEALRRATAATSFDDGIAWMGPLLDAALPANVDDDGRIGVRYRAINLRAASFNDALFSINHACSATASTDSNRQQVCTALTELLLRSDNLMERSVGARLGERLGLPADTMKAAMRPVVMSRESWFADAAGFGCRGGTKPMRYLEDFLAFGEIDAIRRVSERAGR